MFSRTLVYFLLAFVATNSVALPTAEVADEVATTDLEVRAASTVDAGFKAKGKRYWGAAVDHYNINNSQNQNVVRTHFGQVTHENSLKWDATEPNRGQFNLGNADTVVNWATSNGKQIRGHTLLWHEQLPQWVKNIGDRNTLTSVIQNHVSNVAGRYRGKIYAWDVVNEIFEWDGSFRRSVFYNVLGEDFVRIAFQAARQADPNAKLYINDFGLDSVNSKSNAVANLVRRVNSQYGKIIDGIGTQVHLGGNDAGGVQSALSLFANVGVEVAITELDIAGASSNDYVTVARACLNVPACVGITSWGTTDAGSWRAETNPLLFDRNYQPKAAYQAILNIL